MEFLHQCPQVKIEDILPFFSDFVTIDDFKDAICTSLQVSIFVSFCSGFDSVLFPSVGGFRVAKFHLTIRLGFVIAQGGIR